MSARAVLRALAASLGLALSLTLAPAVVAAQGTRPAAAPDADTDIWLAPLAHRGDSVVVGPAVNVTHRPGYDNQPAFTPDSRAILYTARDLGQSDIWRYDLRTHASRRITRTAESEYSPTVMPGGRRISVVRVERDSAQRLWSVALDGSDARLLLPGITRVGYHLWLGPTRLAVYTQGTPTALHLVNRDGSGDTVVARDVGRALQRIPNSTVFSYTQRDTAGHRRVMAGSGATADLGGETIVPGFDDDEYQAWTPDGTLLGATHDVLQRWNGKKGRISGWLPVVDLAALAHVRRVSRLAVSPDGRWLAFVAEPAAP